MYEFTNENRNKKSPDKQPTWSCREILKNVRISKKNVQRNQKNVGIKIQTGNGDYKEKKVSTRKESEIENRNMKTHGK